MTKRFPSFRSIQQRSDSLTGVRALLLPALMVAILLISGCSSPAYASPETGGSTEYEICSPGWFEQARLRGGPMMSIGCPMDVGSLSESSLPGWWGGAFSPEGESTEPLDVIWVEPEELPIPDQPIDWELFIDAGWGQIAQPSNEMREFIDTFPMDSDVEPVWRPEQRALELWVDPDADPAPLLDAAEARGLNLAEITVRHREFSRSALDQASEAVWAAREIAGNQISMTSIRYDGTGIDVGFFGAFDGPLSEPVAWFDGVPVYPTFGQDHFVPLPLHTDAWPPVNNN